MVLIDFGVRWMPMHADISRTVPASGRFDPLKKMLYEIVLKAQLAVEKNARAGKTIAELNDLCWGSINSDLKNIFQDLVYFFCIKSMVLCFFKSIAI